MQVKKAFSERRKMLRNTLQPLYTPLQVGVLGISFMVASARLLCSTCNLVQTDFANTASTVLI